MGVLRKKMKSGIWIARRLRSLSAQAYTEYVVILTVLLGVGVGTATVLVGFDTLDDIFVDYYAGVANYLNLPFF